MNLGRLLRCEKSLQQSQFARRIVRRDEDFHCGDAIRDGGVRRNREPSCGGVEHPPAIAQAGSLWELCRIKGLAAPLDRDQILLNRRELPAGKRSIGPRLGGPREDRHDRSIVLEGRRLTKQLLQQTGLVRRGHRRLGQHRGEIVGGERTEHGRRQHRIAVCLDRHSPEQLISPRELDLTERVGQLQPNLRIGVIHQLGQRLNQASLGKTGLLAQPHRMPTDSGMRIVQSRNENRHRETVLQSVERA